MKKNIFLKQPPLIKSEIFKAEEDHRAGTFDISMKLKSSISDAIRQSGKSRYEIAAKISELTGHDLTKSMLDQYTAESREDCCLPARVLNALCFVTGSFEPLNVILEPLEAIVVSGEERCELELMQIDRDIHALEQKKLQLKASIKRAS